MACLPTYKGIRYSSEAELNAAISGKKLLSPDIKQGVSELFESNPELANAVYEVLGFTGTKSASVLDAIKKYLKEENYRLKTPAPSWITDTTTTVGKMLEQIDTPIVKDTIAFLRQQNKKIQELKTNANLITNELYKQAGIDPVKLLEDESTQIENIQRVQKGEKRLPTLELDKLNDLKTSNRNLYEQIEDLGDKQAKLIRESSNAFEKEVKKFFNSLIEYDQKEIGTIITPQQKQQAQQLYSQYLDSLNKPNTNPNIEGFKEFVSNNTLRSIVSNNPIANRQMLNTIVKQLNKSFPMVKIELITNDDVEAADSTSLGFIRDGVVYINVDKAEAGTPLHEVSHIVIEYIAKYRPMVYAKIKGEIMEMIAKNDPIIEMLKGKKEYSKLSTDDFIKEVFATVSGWRGQDNMEGIAAKYGNNETERSGIMRFIKKMITYARVHLSSMFGRLFGQKMSLNIGDNTTLFGVIDMILDKIESGDVVFTGDASILDEYKVYRSATVIPPKVANTENLVGLLLNPSDPPKEVKMEEWVEMQLNVLKAGHLIKTINDEPITYAGNEKETRAKLEDAFKKVYGDNTKFWKDVEGYIKADADQRKAMAEKFSGKEKWKLYKLEKIIRMLNPSDINAIYKLSDTEALKSIGINIDPDMADNDYYIVVERSKDNVIGVSIYNFEMDYSSRTAPGVKIDKMMKAFGVRSHDDNVSLRNILGDAKQMALYLFLQKMKKDNPQLQILDSAVLFIAQGQDGNDIHLDYGKLRRAQMIMGKSKNFMERIEDNWLREIIENPVDIGNPDYEKVLISFYNSSDVLKYNKDNETHVGIWKYYNRMTDGSTPLLPNEKLAILIARQKYLNGIINKSVEQEKESYLVARMIYSLSNSNRYMESANTLEDVNKNKIQIASPMDVGQEFSQTYRRQIKTAEYFAVEKTKAFQNEFEPIAKEFRKILLGRNGRGLKEYFRDAGNDYFEPLFVTEVIDGKEIKTGYIYWTTDETLDPVNAKKAQRALADKKITKDMLKVGQWVVDAVHKNMVEMYWHVQVNKGSKYGGTHYKDKDGKILEYTLAKAEEDMMSHGDSGLSYKKGMIPIMYRTVGDYITKGQFRKAGRKASKQMTNIYGPQEETIDLDNDQIYDNDEYLIEDMFINQFLKLRPGVSDVLGSMDSDYGNMARQNLLGIEFDMNAAKWVIKNDERPSMISSNLWNILTAMTLNHHRKIEYENRALPVYNAIKIIIDDLADKRIDLTNARNLLDNITHFQVKGKPMEMKSKVLGVNLEKTALGATSAAGTWVMLLNVNVSILSTISNGMSAWIEAIANLGYDEAYYTPKTLLKASAAFFTDYHKVQAINELYQVMNMEELSLLTNPQHKPFSNHPFTRHFSNIGNFASDKYARLVAVVAHMMHVGSWEAHSWDKEKRVIVYDQSKDKRWEGERGKAALKSMIEMQKEQGMLGLDDKKLVVAHDQREIMRLKYIANKYIVGAYGAKERNMLSTHFVGRLAMLFNTYLTSRLQNAFQKAEYIQEGGWYKTRLVDGTYITEWESRFVEGYMNTMFTQFLPKVFYAIKDKNNVMTAWNSLNSAQKYNLHKMWTMSAILMLFLLLSLGFKDPEDEERKRRKREEKSIKQRISEGDMDVFEDVRIMRNFEYAVHDLWVVGSVTDFIARPFAGLDILGRLYRSIFVNHYDTTFERIVESGGGIGSTYKTIDQIF